MWVGDILGESLAFAYLRFVLQLDAWKFLWVAWVVGELTKAWLGGFWAQRALRRPVTSDQRARMALGYTMSVTLGALIAPLGASLIPGLSTARWLAGALAFGSRLAARGVVVVAAVVLAGIAAAILLRYLLLTVLGPASAARGGRAK
ncbi:MAG: hypothetical protein M3O50_19815, partial [Myxococcota bacterium]|nr:hypothetical protein [Myxococcota bacterium]